jgi:hypothetical protein
MRQQFERIRLFVLVAVGLCLAAPASALGADLTAPVTEAAGGAAATATAATEATTSEPTAAAEPRAATAPSPPESSAPVSRDSGAAAPGQTGARDVAKTTSDAGSSALDKAESTASALGDSATEAVAEPARDVASAAGDATRAVTETRRDAESVVGSAGREAIQTAEGARESVQQVAAGISEPPPSGGIGGDGAGITTPPVILPGPGGGGGLGGVATPALTVPGIGGVDRVGGLLPSSRVGAGPSAAGAPVSNNVLAPVAGRDHRPPTSLAGRSSDPTLAATTGPIDSLFASAAALSAQIFGLGSQLSAGDLPSSASADGVPGAPAPGPAPFALPSLGGAFASSTLLVGGLLALLTIFFLSAPGLGRWIRTSAEKWPPPGLVSPIEVPG